MKNNVAAINFVWVILSLAVASILDVADTNGNTPGLFFMDEYNYRKYALKYRRYEIVKKIGKKIWIS